MSRKWGRMVEKNKKVINKQRTKQGQSLISNVYKEPKQRFLGRSWFLPLLCIGISFFFVVAYGTANLYITIAYFLLGLFIYYVRRPSLSIGKNTLSSRRFSRDVTVAPEEIEEITIQPGYVIVQMKVKKSRWVFSRLIHRFDIKSMSEKIKEYALLNNVTFIDQTKGETKA
jgi:hypothetical protein